jgi:hypothetical protein
MKSHQTTFSTAWAEDDAAIMAAAAKTALRKKFIFNPPALS